MNARLLASVVAAVGLFGSLPFWWWLHQAPETAPALAETPIDAPQAATAAEPPAPSPDEQAPAPAGAETAAADPSAEERRPIARPAPELITGPDRGRSPIADRLNAPDTSIEQDLVIVKQLLDNHRFLFGGNPTGSNREITAQLSGANLQKHAPLPPDATAIGPSGELLDRWGTPFFFHALGAHAMEIRSAGPDREMFTDDDALSSPTPQ